MESLHHTSHSTQVNSVMCTKRCQFGAGAGGGTGEGRGAAIKGERGGKGDRRRILARRHPDHTRRAEDTASEPGCGNLRLCDDSGGADSDSDERAASGGGQRYDEGCC